MTTNTNSAMMTESFQERLVGMTISSPGSDYKVEAVLGSSAYGVTLQCHKKLTNETVVLRVMKQGSFYKSAKQEVRILETLNGAGSKDFHIVTLNDTFTFEGQYCLEFKKLDISLHDYKAEKSLSLMEIRAVLFQMVEILHFLESSGIVHLEVKPENIMFVDQLHQPLKIELINFGCARTGSEMLQGSIHGTLSYMAPEMLVGASCNHSVDMWALGCVAAQMLTGSCLFKGRGIYDVIQRILKTAGMLPDHMLSAGNYTKQYFKKGNRSRQSHIWELKSPSEVRYEEWSQFQERSLDDILKVSSETAEEGDDALECDRKAFVDLVTKMLHVDPAQRITPEEAMEHPFLTLSHLDINRHNNYVKLSTEAMEVCDMKKLKEKGFPRCSAISDSISPEESRIPSDATRRRTKTRTSKKSTDVSLPWSFFVFFLLFSLANLSLLAPFRRGSGTYLLFAEKNLLRPDFDSFLMTLNYLPNPENVGLTARPDPRKRNRKRVRLLTLPTGAPPTAPNQFLDTVWSLIVKMEKIRLKTADLCMSRMTQIWKKDHTPCLIVTLTSTVVYIAILWYHKNYY